MITTIELTDKELAVLTIIAAIHDMDDLPGEYYPAGPFQSLLDKVVAANKRQEEERRLIKNTDEFLGGE